MLAARALEAKDPSALEFALERDAAAEESDRAFSTPDHLALGSLSEREPANLGASLETARKHDDYRALVWAVISAFELDLALPELGDLKTRTALVLGRALAVPSVTALQKAAEAAAAHHPGHPLLALVRMESARQQQDVQLLASTLVESSTQASAELQMQAAYCAGLLCELNREHALADRYYSQALRSSAFGEAAARALFERLPPGRVSKLLWALADNADNRERKSLLLLEAVLRDPDQINASNLCEQAHTLDPQSILPLFVGEREARRRRDHAQAEAWLRRQREQPIDDQARALILLRAARVDGDRALAHERIAAARQIWQTDLALSELCDANLELEPRERAERREYLATSALDPTSRAQLQLEAAWYYEAASHAADSARLALMASGNQPLAELCLERTLASTPSAEAYKEQLHLQLVNASTSIEFAELYLKLSALEGQEQQFERQIKYLGLAAQRVPDHLPTLAELEGLATWHADPKQLLLSCGGLAALLPAEDAPALVGMAARLERLENGWGAAYPVLKQTPRSPRIPLLLVRQLLAHARVLNEPAMAYEMTRRLSETPRAGSDLALLQLSAAQLAARLEDRELALSHVRKALEAEPRHLPALALYAKLLREQGQPAQAATAYERLAQTSRVSAHQVAHWYTAAILWLEEVNDRERGQADLEHAVRLDPAHSAAFERLRALYQERQEHRKLEALVNHRLQAVTDRENVAQLQLMKSQALIGAGDTQKAKEALLLVVKASPENLEALTQLASLSEQGGDAQSAEHALLQVARLNADPGVQANVYERLAKLYTGPLANPKRALRCHQEVLRRRPDDPVAFDAMLQAYVDVGQPERAVELLEQRRQREQDSEQDLVLWLRIARLQASTPKLIPAAEQSYADLLTQKPARAEVLGDAARFYIATERTQYVKDWCQRLLEQGRHSLEQLKLNKSIFEQLETIASALDDSALAELARSAKELAQGNNGLFAGVQGRAMSRHLDGRLAPPTVSSALRTLLMQTRGILDQALELNLAPLSPKRVSGDRVRIAFEQKSRAMGVSLPELFTTSAEPTLALVTGSPSRVILGSYWVNDAPQGVLDFIAWRTLKADQARVGLFAQLDPKRLNTVLLAFLSCFVEVHLSPPDLPLFETTRQRVASRLSKTIDDDVPVLALEVLTLLRDDKPDLSLAVRRWLNRSALLASGDPESATRALAVLSSGSVEAAKGSPSAIASQYPECRDVLGSMLDDAFVEAYRQGRSQT
jgi:hypothetical protein